MRHDRPAQWSQWIPGITPVPDMAPGLRAPGGRNFCFLFGRTEPFGAATLAKLYPTHDALVRKFNAAVDEMVRLGYWLKAKADLARAAAAAAEVEVT